ncbi:hypothetical protein P7K49_015485, partial [Saguinus oedipus]
MKLPPYAHYNELLKEKYSSLNVPSENGLATRTQFTGPSANAGTLLTADPSMQSASSSATNMENALCGQSLINCYRQKT